MMRDPNGFIHRIDAAFNARAIDTLLAVMHPDVVWPNGMVGGTVLRHAAVHDYWIWQWQQIDPHVERQRVVVELDGAFRVTVHQVVRDLDGPVLHDQQVDHVYTLEDGRIRRMVIAPVGEA